MTPEDRRELNRRRRMTQPVRLTMGQLAVVRESLLLHRDAYAAAVKPFGLITTWEALNRLDDVFGLITAARCDLKRRQHPDYNPAGDSECAAYATAAKLDAWYEAHPLPEEAAE